MPTVTVKPADGGQLITRAAAIDAGIPHYTRKLNWRRDLTDEVRREGHDYFNPLPDAEDALEIPFPAPNGEPITLIHFVRRPNGEAAVVVGTKSTLYRLDAAMLGVVENPPLYVDGLNDGPGGAFQPYFKEPRRWEVIGDGFSQNGKRWEAVDINGTTVFNNAVNLPVAYRVEWEEVEPLYELREQGVVCVGTIAEINGILVCSDITELTDEDMDEVLNVTRSNDIRAWQTGERQSGATTWATSDGTTVTSNLPFFVAGGDEGRLLVWFNGKKQRIITVLSPTQVQVEAGDPVALGTTFSISDAPEDLQWESLAIRTTANFFTPEMRGSLIGFASGEVRKIVGYFSPTLVSTDALGAIPEAEIFIENPITYYSKTELEAYWEAKGKQPKFNRRQYRQLWSEVGDPTKFAAQVPVGMAEGSRVMRTDRMNRSIKKGDALAIVGGGENGGTLIRDSQGNPVTALSVGPGVVMASEAILTSAEGHVMRASSVGSIVGAYDLQDDGAAILKAKPLQNRLVVYTDTNIHLARFTGNPEKPFDYERIKVEHGRSLYYRHTLVSLQDSAHIYAGKTAFYQFDLSTRQPVPIQSADLISNLFFDYASIEDTEEIYAADNQNTQEAFIVCPKNPSDPTIAYDYTYRTFSTVDYAPTAAAPLKGAWLNLVGATGDIFLMGTSDGTLLQYGRATEPQVQWGGEKSIYYRRGGRPYGDVMEGYWGKIKDGAINFQDAFNEKHLTSFLLQLSSQGDTPPIVTVNLYTSLNQSGPETLAGTMDIVDPDNHGLIPCHFIGHNFSSEIVSNTPDEVRLHLKTWDFFTVKSRSTHKRP